jgi:hypothetical protein
MFHIRKALKRKLSSFLVILLVIVWLVLLLTSTVGCGLLSFQAETPTPLRVARATPTPTRTATVTPRPTRSATPSPTPGPRVRATATRAPNVNPLTGLAVKNAALLKRRPIHVRIGNDPQIRPQSGLSQADLVYEEIMDGWWITRLTAVFLSQTPQVIGPVRSARLVNLELASQFDAALVHAGASDQIRWLISQSDIVDLDEYFHPKPYYYVEENDWRGRLFTNGRILREYMAAERLEKALPLEGFTFSTKRSPPPEGSPAPSFVVPYPKSSLVEWRYDDASGFYLRFVQDQMHTDAVSGKQLQAANVIVQHVRHEKTDIVEDSLGTTSIKIVLTGQGQAEIFRDGVLIQSTWKCEGPKQLTRYLDEKGNPVPLKPGNSWIELVPLDYQILVAGSQ